MANEIDNESMQSNMVIERERRKLLKNQDAAETAEERFKQEFAKALRESKEGVAKEVRDAVNRSKNGESWYKNQRNDSGFTGLGVKEEDL